MLAVDLPSGWGADETAATAAGPVFPADAVITFTAPKPAHVFGHLTRRWEQPIVVAPIGSPEEAIVSAHGVGLGGLGAGAHPDAAGGGGQQGQLWPCAGGRAGQWDARARWPWRRWRRCVPERGW